MMKQLRHILKESVRGSGLISVFPSGIEETEMFSSPAEISAKAWNMTGFALDKASSSYASKSR